MFSYERSSLLAPPFPHTAHQIYVIISDSGRAGYFVYSQLHRSSSPGTALFYMHVLVSVNRQLCSLFYSVRQLHHVCRVNAEEDVQDFRQLRPGLDSHQVAGLFLCAERSLHRGRPYPGKLYYDKVEGLCNFMEWK